MTKKRSEKIEGWVDPVPVGGKRKRKTKRSMKIVGWIDPFPVKEKRKRKTERTLKKKASTKR